MLELTQQSAMHQQERAHMQQVLQDSDQRVQQLEITDQHQKNALQGLAAHADEVDQQVLALLIVPVPRIAVCALFVLQGNKLIPGSQLHDHI